MRGKRTRTDYKGIYAIDKNKFEIHISLGRNPITGKYEKKSEVFEGLLRDARKRQGKMLEETQNRNPAVAGMTLSEFADSYFDSLALSGSTSTIKTDKGRWRVLKPSLGDRKVRSITTFELQQVMNGLMKTREWKPQTFNRYRSVLSGMFSNAVAMQVADHNPVTKLPIKTPTHVRRTAIDAEVVANVMRSLYDYDPLICNIVQLACLLGCRRSEVLGLQVSDWNEELQQLTIQRGVKTKEGGGYSVGDAKAHNIRTFVPHPDAIQIVKEQLAAIQPRRDGIRTLVPPHSFIFSPNNGVDPFIPDSMSQRFNRIKERMCPNCYTIAIGEAETCSECSCVVGVTLKMHQLRRFTTTTQLRAGVNPAYVQYTGGWKNQTTMLAHYSDFHTADAEASHAAMSNVFKKEA